ncbi:hypothetical protein [Deinococcus radiophilus]|uniref:hypothetical protein n=1 Tax=Deinococcus radiophilus TaxID=32062 RepID=UPI00360A6454
MDQQRRFHAPAHHAGLGFEAGCRPIGLIYLGYVDGEWPQGQRGEATDRVRWFRES